ncbi:diaminopimelate epimerase [Trichlorobacter lovleyi]|uniref:Diaminopimelate epimerase n=1 Tax=Trichlorobacter lovleyi (strain ATCC BAA-1151 / DSM 17278 / SZ) TaxID=398767 RepID=B3EBJ0_TRIL1|nr:diaminopimelate epimerase [Trichlorobacter lovleyi]ACD97029.1 Diaminopimelate epimerase [Trichlorobacter lovleyi SZ]
MKFTKMHGAGNDYVYVDCFKETVDNPAETAIKVSNRNFGIGSDGLILIMPTDKADVRMRMFNSDGSESEMCGNGIRCVAKYAYDHGIVTKTEITAETGAGILTLQLFPNAENKVERVRVNMGPPRLSREEIPMNGTPAAQVVAEELTVLDKTFKITCVSMGNPHCIIYVDDVDNFPVATYGPLIENHQLFPRRTNVEFIQIISRTEVKQRTWERGAGETLACGTGASAVCVAGVLNNLTDRKILNHLAGGDLELEWVENGPVFMTGPATEVFSGEIAL